MNALKIYTILTFTKLEIDEHKWPVFGSERLVGYYADKQHAIEAVKNNNADINETCYDYALVEEVEEGLYQPANSDKRWLFKFNRDTKLYEPIEEPDWLHEFSGFTIG